MTRSPFDPRPATNSHYAGRVPLYAAAWGPVLAVLAAPLFAALATLTPRRVLDLGCGVGGARERLPRAPVYVGADHFGEMLHEARRREPSLLPVLADAVRLPFGDRSFDLVFAGFMLHHVREQWRALGEMHRVLRPGGTLALAGWGALAPEGSASEAFEESLHEAGAPDEDPTPPPVWCESVATPDAVASLTEASGFTRIRIWKDRPAWTWPREMLLAYRSGLGGSGRRFARLERSAQARCLERAAARLAALPDSALRWEPEILFARLERPLHGEDEA